jgi:hypothetical protein
MEKNIKTFWIFSHNLYKNYVQYIVNLIFFQLCIFENCYQCHYFLDCGCFQYFLVLVPNLKRYTYIYIYIYIYIYEIIINQVI